MNNNSKKDLDDDVDVDVSPTDNAQPGKNADDSLAEEADVAAAAAEKAKNAYDKANAAADSAEKVYKEAKNAADKAENAADEAENAAAKKAYEEAARAWNASKRRFDAAKKAYDEAAGTAAKATKKEAVADTSTNEGTAAIGWWVFVPMVILMILIGLAIFPINKEFASGWGESGSKLVTVKLDKFVVTALAIAVISACLAVLTQSEYDVTTFCRFHLVPCLMLVLVGIQRFLDRTKHRLNPNAYE